LKPNMGRTDDIFINIYDFIISTNQKIMTYLGHTNLSLMNKRYEWKITWP